METSNANPLAAQPRCPQRNESPVPVEHSPTYFRSSPAQRLVADIMIPTVAYSLLTALLGHEVLGATGVSSRTSGAEFSASFAWAAAHFRRATAKRLSPVSVHSFGALLIVLLLTAAAAFGDVVTFENLPHANFFNGGGQNIGNFYPGLSFGPNVTGLSVTLFGGYADAAFPPHSGDVVVWDPVDPTVTITFASAVPFIGVWYTSFDPLTLSVFDAAHNLLGTSVGNPNTDGTTGLSSFLSFSGPAISSVEFSGSPGLYTFDDVTTSTVPEPSTWVLLASALLLLGFSSRRRGASASSLRGRGPSAVVALLASCAIGVPVLSAQGYTYTPITYPGATSTTVYGINNLGDVVGTFTLAYPPGGSRCFVYSKSTFTVLGLPSGAVCYGINDNGDVVGTYIPGNTYRGFLLSQGVLSDIVAPGSLDTFVFGINNAKHIAGAYNTNRLSGSFTGFMLSSGTYSVIGSGPSYYAIGINNANQIAGYTNGHGFLYSGGASTAITNPGAGVTVAAGINDSAIIVGNGGFDCCGMSGPGFIRGNTGAITGLPSPAWGINNAGQISGTNGSAGYIATPSNCAPSIATQPASQTILVNQPSTPMSVTATGIGPLQFQWYQASTAISGATQSGYNAGTFVSVGAYAYSVTVSNSCGSVTSQQATITVQQACTPAQITTPPSSQTVTSGSPVTVTVAATGSGITYQWYRDGNLIAGATASSYTTRNLTIGDDGMTLSVTVTGQCGASVAASATIHVTPACTPVSIVSSPVSQTVAYASSATLSIVANGSTPNFQWYLSGGVPIPGAASSTYTTPPITGTALYYVGVSNSCSSATSGFAELDVNMPLGPPNSLNPVVITQEPINTATGSYYSVHTDMQVRGPGMAFSLIRIYNSNDPYGGPLGAGWTHSYNLFLAVHSQSNVVAVKQADGSLIYFAPSGSSSYTPVNPGLHDTLVKNSDGSFTLTRKNQLQLVFSPQGRLISIRDRNGNIQALSYDGNGNLTLIKDTAGRVYTFVNDSNGRLSSLTDPSGRTIHYAYDASGNLVTFQDEGGGLTKYSYDSAHRLIGGTDARGITYVQNTYDAQGRVTAQKNGRNQTVALVYDAPAPGTTTVTDARGYSTIYTYDTSMRIRTIQNSLGGKTIFTYDNSNNRLSVTNAINKTTSFTYDSRGNLTSVTNPLGNRVTFTYDQANDLLSVSNPAGDTTRSAYDAAGNLTSITDAISGVTLFTYNARGNLTSRTDALGNKTSLTYDGQGNVAGMTDAAGNTVTISYDVLSRITASKDANGQTLTFSYDALGRRTDFGDALGHHIQYAYDAVGNLSSVVDQNGHKTTYIYDEVNRLVSVTDATGKSAKYGYDENGNRTSVTDANGHTTKYSYDALNRRITLVTAGGQSTGYAYDAVGNLTSTSDGNGKAHTFTYDDANRIIRRSYADGTVVTYTYDANGNRISMTDGRGLTGYAYDALNRLIVVTNPDGSLVKYAYDKGGHRQSVTYPSGRVVSYSYDPVGRLGDVKDWAGRTTHYTYDPVGNRIRIDFGNGATSTYGYDAANRLVSIVNSSQGRVLTAFMYTLDNVGNRIAAKDATGGVNRYAYDALNRLVSWTAPSGQTASYTYDAVGNRTAVSSPTAMTTYAYDSDDRVASAGAALFAYDGNGNMVSKTAGNATWQYMFDSLNRLRTVVGGGVSAKYDYDGDGNRISQQVGSLQYQYVFDVMRKYPAVLAESGSDGSIEYQYGASRLAGSSSNLDQFYQTDALGSTADVTDSSGTLKAAYAYDPWGKLLNPVDPLGTKDKFKFSGEALDPTTGLYCMGARCYDPTLGRFISRDPFSAAARVPLTSNRYAYALSNPVNLVDPSGLAAEPASADSSGWSTYVPYIPSCADSPWVCPGSGGFTAPGPAPDLSSSSSPGGVIYGPADNPAFRQSWQDPSFRQAWQVLDITEKGINGFVWGVENIGLPLITAGAPTFVTTFTKIGDFGLNVAKGMSEGKDFGDAVTDAATDAYKDYLIDQWTDPIFDWLGGLGGDFPE